MQDNAANVLANYLADTEEIFESHHDEDQTVAVTTERLVRVTHEETSAGRDVVNARAVNLAGPSVLGCEIEAAGETDPDLGGLVFGGIIAAVGLGAFVLAAGMNGPIASLAPAPGLVLLAVAAGLAYSALQTDPGAVVVNVLSTGGDEAIQLPQDAEHVGTAVSRAIARQA